MPSYSHFDSWFKTAENDGVRNNFKKVIRGAKTLGADIVLDEHKQGDFDCPFNVCLAIRYPKTVVIDDTSTVAQARRHRILTNKFVGEIIHELGHLLAAGDTNETAEYMFLGWEYAFAKTYALVAPWREHMESYYIGLGADYLQEMSRTEQRKLLQERMAVAESLGYVRNGKPVARALQLHKERYG